MDRCSDLSHKPVIVFDFDGTIADTKAAIIETASTVLLGWGFKPEDLSRVGELIGPPFPQAYEMVFGLSHEDAVEVTRRYREIYVNLDGEAWPAFSGIPELLRDLRAAGRHLAVASSKMSLLVHRGLKDNGLWELFDAVCTKEDDEATTKEDAIRRAVGRLGMALDDAVMVGDRFHDVEAAIACGIPCVGVLYGDTAEPGELERAGAVAIAERVDDLRTILLGCG